MAFVTHQATVVSQCTTKHCHSGDTDMSALTALDLVTQLQDTVERQQDVLEQQRNENDEQHTQLVILRETVEQQQRCNQELQRLFNDSLEQLQQQNQEQQKQLARIEETLAKQDKSMYYSPTAICNALFAVVLASYLIAIISDGVILAMLGFL